jgi:hypothetical protein
VKNLHTKYSAILTTFCSLDASLEADKKEMRIAAYLPEARRETRGRARVLPARADK